METYEKKKLLKKYLPAGISQAFTTATLQEKTNLAEEKGVAQTVRQGAAGSTAPYPRIDVMQKYSRTYYAYRH